MLSLTTQERRVVLFLVMVALAGSGIKFFMKLKPSVEKALKADYRLAKLDLNKAALEDLIETNLISPKLASKIIAYRNGNGPFRSVEDLKEVKGIGDYRLEKLKGLFYIE